MKSQPMIDYQYTCICKAIYDRVCIKHECSNGDAIYSSDCKCNPVGNKNIREKSKRINSHKMYRCPISSTISFEHFRQNYLKVVNSPIYSSTNRDQFKYIIKFTQKYNKGQFENIQGDQMHYVWAQITKTINPSNSPKIMEQKKRQQNTYNWEKKPQKSNKIKFLHTEKSIENIKLHELPMFKDLQRLYKQIQDMQKKKSSVKIAMIKSPQKRFDNSLPQSSSQKSKDNQIKECFNSLIQIKGQQDKIKQKKKSSVKIVMVKNSQKNFDNQFPQNPSQKSSNGQIKECLNSLIQIKGQQDKVKQNRKSYKITMVKNPQKKLDNQLPQNSSRKPSNGEIKECLNSVIQIKDQQDKIKQNRKSSVKIVMIKDPQKKLDNQLPQNSSRKPSNDQIKECLNSVIQIKDEQDKIKQNRKSYKINMIKNPQKKVYSSQPSNLHQNSQKSSNGQIKEYLNSRIQIKGQQADNTDKNKQKQHFQSKQETKFKKIINEKGQKFCRIKGKKQHSSDASSNYKGNFDSKNNKPQQNQINYEDDDDDVSVGYTDEYQDMLKSYKKMNKMQIQDQKDDNFSNGFNRNFKKNQRSYLHKN